MFTTLYLLAAEGIDDELASLKHSQRETGETDLCCH